MHETTTWGITSVKKGLRTQKGGKKRGPEGPGWRRGENETSDVRNKV